MKTIIIGIGNTMLADDAIGPLTVQALKNCGAPAMSLELDAFTAATYLENVDLAIFIDTLEPVYGQPGQIIQLQLDPTRLSPEEMAKAFSRELSSHHPTPADVVLLAYSSGIFKGKAILIGIVPETLEFAHPPSTTTISKIKEICEKVAETANLQIDCNCVEANFKESLKTLKI